MDTKTPTAPVTSPAPWSFHGNAIVDAEGCYVAMVGGGNDAAIQANARLLAAAPALVAALRQARTDLRLLNLTDDGAQKGNTHAARTLAAIDAALAKAES